MASMQQTYEDFKPLVEEKNTPDALLLLVHLPGFTKEQVGASFEADSRKIKVFGEKPIDNKRKRFKVEYVIPETCECDKLKGKFEGTVITITMPKKPISSVTPTEPKTIQEATKQVTPPKSTSEVKKDEKGVSQEQGESEKERMRESDKKDETQTPPEATTGESEKSQKNEEISQKGRVKEEEKHKDQMETKDVSTPEKAKGQSRTTQKDQDGTPQKGKLDHEKKHEENEKAEKERIQEDKRKTSEAGKEPHKVSTLAKETSKDKTSSGLKAPEERKNEKDVKTGKVNQRNEGTKESELPIVKGFKDIANSASQAITKLADRIKEEDERKLIYAGAAILIVAVGIYANFKLRSPGGQ